MPIIQDAQQAQQGALDQRATPEPGSAPVPSPQAVSPTTEGGGPGGTPATAQEQEGKDKIVLAASQFLYNEKMSSKVIDTLTAAQEDPAAGISSVAASVIDEIDKQSKGQLPVDLILPATEEILELIGEMGESAQLFEYTDKLAAQSAQKAIELIGPAYGVGEEEIQAMMDAVGPEQSQAMRQQFEGLTGGAQGPEAEAGLAGEEQEVI